ncbi:MAG: HDIG domain-containing metalloprotein [Candidatus Cloacimonadia bacterium]
MISRKEAEEILFEHLKSENLRRHSLATAAVMEKLAERFDKPTEEWFIAGLLHDIDFEQTADDPDKHGVIAMQLLENVDINDEMKGAILAHSGNAPLNTLMDKALWSADAVNGLIIAAALMRPDKSIKNIELKSLKKKYKNRAFAAGANREQIAKCCDFGIELDDFLQLSIEALASYETELGFGNK